MHAAMLKYTVLRLALFVASLTALWAVGVRQSLLMLVLAALISLALSYLLLARQRDEFAQALSERIGARVERRQGAEAASEDEAVERAERERAEAAGRADADRVRVDRAEREAKASEHQADGEQHRVDE